MNRITVRTLFSVVLLGGGLNIAKSDWWTRGQEEFARHHWRHGKGDNNGHDGWRHRHRHHRALELARRIWTGQFWRAVTPNPDHRAIGGYFS